MADETSNPFKAFVVDGKQFFHTGADDRVRLVKAFTEAQCHAALAVDGLQKTVADAVARRLRQLSKPQARGAA